MDFGMSIVVGLLVAAVAVAIAAKRANIPYNIALVVGGMLIAVTGVLPSVPHLDPEIVFLVCLPVLLFEGGLSADLAGIRLNAAPITVTATLGMIFSIAATAALLAFALGLPWGAAFLLGAVLSVTDTVSILYAFRRAAVPARLSAIVQGESLFNDGTALVAYASITSVVVGGHFSLPSVAADVVIATLGGVSVGLALGFGAGFVVRWTEDPLTEIMATTALALASYGVAEGLHVSGAIAVVVAGLAMGSALRAHSTPQTQVAIHSFWEYVAFGVNTFLFLSVGLTTRPESLIERLPQSALAILCVFVGRAVGIYASLFLLGRARPTERLPWRWQHVFIVGNIKGALSIGLVLGLPAGAPFRGSLIDIAFGVTFISLVGQGLLLAGALRRMGLIREDQIASTIAEQQGRLLAARAARQELEALHGSGLISRDGYERLRCDYQVSIAAAERELRKLQEHHLAHGARLLLATRRRLIDAERTALLGARRAGLIAEATAERLLAEVDDRLLRLEHVLSEDVAPEVERGPTRLPARRTGEA